MLYWFCEKSYVISLFYRYEMCFFRYQCLHRTFEKHINLRVLKWLRLLYVLECYDRVQFLRVAEDVYAYLYVDIGVSTILLWATWRVVF